VFAAVDLNRSLPCGRRVFLLTKTENGNRTRGTVSTKNLTSEVFYHEHKPFLSRAQAFVIVRENLFRREQKGGGRTCDGKKGDANQRKGGGR
jgi:hypothetical protein